MAEVIVYTGQVCPYCTRAKALLTKKGVGFEEIMVDLDPDSRQKLAELTGRRTVPQIIIDGHVVGGWDELSAADRSGDLDRLLASASD
jgi:glutaredoxin 3